MAVAERVCFGCYKQTRLVVQLFPDTYQGNHKPYISSLDILIWLGRLDDDGVRNNSGSGQRIEWNMTTDMYPL